MENEGILASLHHTISSHKSDVNGVSFNNKKLATCSGDKTVRLWDTEEFNELACSPLCGHTYYVHCCSFSPFGTLLATCSTDGKIIIWDMKTGTKQCSLQHESKSPVRVCTFSPNSVMLASGGDDNMLCLWDVSTKKLLRTLQAHEATVFGVAFTPDSQYVVSGCSNGNINIWDAKFGHGKALFNILEGHDLGVTCCDFSPTFGSKGQESSSRVHFLLATSGQDDLVKLWDFISEVDNATNPLESSASKPQTNNETSADCDAHEESVQATAVLDSDDESTFDAEEYVNTCAHCLKESSVELQKCSKCKSFRYCSKECQIFYWPRHKSVCKLLQAELCA